MKESPPAMKRWIEKLLNRNAQPAHLKTGLWGERQAVRMLKNKRYTLLGQRVRVGRRDEIDIVAEQNGVLVFVEVKTRKNENYGRPFVAVNAEKRKHLSRAAVGYLKRRKIMPEYIRFDVVEIIGEAGGDRPEIRHIENAFPLDPAYRLWW